MVNQKEIIDLDLSPFFSFIPESMKTPRMARTKKPTQRRNPAHSKVKRVKWTSNYLRLSFRKID